MAKKSKQKSTHRIQNRIVWTFVLTLGLTFIFGLIVFYLAAQAAQTIDANNGLAKGVSGTDATIIEHNIDRITHASFLFLSLGSVIFMSLMFNLMFSITPALRRISFAIKEIGKGNFDYRLKLPVDNELGDIADTLNFALDKVLISEKELEQEKAGVERLVERRTRQLKLEQGKFLASINGLPLGFILADNKGHILMLNPAMERLLNLSKTGTDELEIAKQVTGEGSFLKKLLSSSQKAIKNKKTTTMELTTEDGKYLHSLLSPITISSEELSGVVILVEDVTEAKIIERSKDEFFSIASHELRTPLTAIRGNTSLIQQFYDDQLKGGDGDLGNMVEDIHSSSVRLIEIVNDFLDASRLEQGKVKLKPQAMHIETIIESVIYEMSAVTQEKHLYIKTDTATLKHLPQVFADPDRVKQILYNLVGNALKFVDEGGVTVKTEVDGKKLRVSIIDTGRGISTENQQLLFHKFQQANTSILTRDATRGTGLGLYISKLLAEEMGGNVSLDHSEEGKGSTFSFTLPLLDKD